MIGNEMDWVFKFLQVFEECEVAGIAMPVSYSLDYVCLATARS
jgi:hypothetical protein